MIDFNLLNQVADDLQTAVRAAWPYFPDTLPLKDTQSNRVSWREMLGLLERSNQDVGDFGLPWAVIEIAPTQADDDAAITNFSFRVPIRISMVTSSWPVKAIVGAVTLGGQSVTVDDASGIFVSQRLEIASSLTGIGVVRTVTAVAGSSITFDSAVPSVGTGWVVKSFDVTAEITRMLEQLRDEIFQGSYCWQIGTTPSIDASMISDVNQQLMMTNYAVQGGQLMAELIVAAVWS